jgi:D-3-phosphoglycerate dehydrogenase
MNKALRDFYLTGNRAIRQLVNREVLSVRTH